MKLTQLQRDVLFNVANGHRWAVDKRALNALIRRGLVELDETSIHVRRYVLTQKGDEVADQIEEEILNSEIKKLA